MKKKDKYIYLAIPRIRKPNIPPKVKMAFLVVTAVAIFVGSFFGLRDLWRSDVPKIARDFVVATVAHIKAGDKIPFEADYKRGGLVDPKDSWGIYTNSQYLTDWIMKIVPYFAYEKVIWPWDVEYSYPMEVYLIPGMGETNFHLLGRAYCMYGMIFYNVRMVTKVEPDERQMIATMVHEMIHLQYGDFCGVNKIVSSQEIESKTQTATIEVLAAMCTYGEKNACPAFWYEIEGMARDSLAVRFHEAKLDKLYNFIENTLWRTKQQTIAYKKSMRFWASDMDQYWGIIRNYGQYPWERYVIPGVNGHLLDTGKAFYGYWGEVLGMPQDDTYDVLGVLRWLLILIK